MSGVRRQGIAMGILLSLSPYALSIHGGMVVVNVVGYNVLCPRALHVWFTALQMLGASCALTQRCGSVGENETRSALPVYIIFAPRQYWLAACMRPCRAGVHRHPGALGVCVGLPVHGVRVGDLCMAGVRVVNLWRGAAVAELCCGQYCQRACGAVVVVVRSLSSSLVGFDGLVWRSGFVDPLVQQGLKIKYCGVVARLVLPQVVV